MSLLTNDVPIKVSKLDAARNQLVTGIRLYFDNADPISIHTLAAAAFEILRDLDRHGQKTGTILDRIKEYVLPEHVEKVRNKFRGAQMFFKHADRDPDGILEYYPSHCFALLWEASEKYVELTQEKPLEIGALRMWFFIHEPDVLLPHIRERLKSLKPERDFPPDKRSEFFKVASLALE